MACEQAHSDSSIFQSEFYSDTYPYVSSTEEVSSSHNDVQEQGREL